MSEKKSENLVGFGKWLGRREAFSLVAGRCSAADAQCLRELRESKEYRELGLNWEDACKQLVGICRRAADQIIRNLEEFGPDFFVIAQVTGIPANEYRRIASAVSDHKLLYAGTEIPIAVENGPRLVEAVSALRREAAEAAEQSGDLELEASRGFAKVDRALRTAVAELERLRRMPLDIGGRIHLQTTIGEATRQLKLIDAQVKI